MESQEAYRERLIAECGRAKWIALALLIVELGVGIITWVALGTLERVVWP